MTTHTLAPAFYVGFAYVLTWAIYRTWRYLEHRRYRKIHAAERIRRARMSQDEEHSLSERLRRAEWDAEYGPLLGGIDLRNREESRWPVVAALQGAATLTASLIIAMLIWNVRSTPTTVPPTKRVNLHSTETVYDNSPTSWSKPVTSSAVPAATSTVTPMSAVPVPPSAPSPQPLPSFPPPSTGELSGTILLVFGLLLTGAYLMLGRRSVLASTTGATLVGIGSLLAGAKLLSIDKLISAKTLFSIQYTPQRVTHESPKEKQTNAENISLRLPAFDTASTAPSAELDCAISTLAKQLAADSEVISIIVIGRADRRPLRNEVEKTYATNWGLAQQRAQTVAGALIEAGIHPSKVVATVAGPLFTSDPQDAIALSRDRATSIIVQTRSGTHLWTRHIQSGEWSACKAGSA